MSLEEGRKGTYLAGSCGGCGEDGVKVAPTIPRAHGGAGCVDSSLSPPEALTSGNQPPLPKGCQPFPHLNTLTCTNRECLSFKTSLKTVWISQRGG